MNSFPGTMNHLALLPCYPMRVTKKIILVLLFGLLCYQVPAQEKDAQQETDLFNSLLYGDFRELGAKNIVQPFGKNETVNRQRLKMATAVRNHKGAGVAANNLGWIAVNKKNYDEALRWFTLALKEFTDGNAAKAMAGTEAEIGMTYRLREDYPAALTHYSRALDGMKKNNMKRGMATVTSAMGQTYSAMKDHTNAIRFFTESMAAYTSLGDKQGMSDLNIQLGEELIGQNTDDEAISYFNKALSQKKELNDKRGQALALRDIGIVYFRKNEYDKALEFFQKSLVESENLQVLKLVRDTYLKLFAESRVNKVADRESLFTRKYQVYKDSVQAILNSRALSPDSLSKELAEKEKIAVMVSRKKDESILAMDADEIELNSQLTEAELERLKTEAAIEEMSKEKRQDEIEARERKEQIQQLQKDKAAQELALSQKQLEQTRQQLVIYVLLGVAAMILFSLAFVYYRYLNNKKSHAALDKAYAELSSTHAKLKNMQTQLVHSEKMASLGQLTAGIAHEIKNPLNFVNNFSELSNELIDEVLVAGSEEERNEILAELKNNLTKINYHGKRADSIVKNMLQHSRTGNSEKAPVDINSMCEEYLMLSYHGMRATDSGFNCAIEKQLDENIGKVKIVPQDISRVLLNLFNNALYAVKERKNSNGETSYQPMVSVITQLLNHSILIRVRDNGTGIPDDVREKIFTPFFTTKPTGEGTGLGLSLSHDIIKAHGGEIKVNSKAVSGTEFLIRLPLS